MNLTDATSMSQVCMKVWSGYIGGNDKSTGSSPNFYGLACATSSPSGIGTRSAVSSVGGGSGSAAFIVEGGTGET